MQGRLVPGGSIFEACATWGRSGVGAVGLSIRRSRACGRVAGPDVVFVPVEGHGSDGSLRAGEAAVFGLICVHLSLSVALVILKTHGATDELR